MKKLINITLIILFAFAIKLNVQANNNYTFHCGDNYELSLVNNQGTFDLVGCYADFDQANTALKGQGDDAVIRHSKSYSNTGIIAINSGIAYSYPVRSGSITLEYEQVSGSKKSYVVYHRELSLPKTISYNGNGTGVINFYLGSMHAKADLKNVDLVPTKFIENQLPIYLGGNDITNTNERPFKIVNKQNYFTVEKNGNYNDLVYYFFSGWTNTGANPTTNKASIGPAPDFMQEGQKYYSYDYVNYYNDNEYNSYAGEHYNYYMYLPARSQSNIQQHVYNDYLSSKGYNAKPKSNNIYSLERNESELWDVSDELISYQNEYGVNALLVFSLAINESGYGRSEYAVNKNNLFGWNAVDSNPDLATDYLDAEDCLKQFMAYHIRGYLDTYDYRYFGMHVGNKGSGFNVKYASDPYWGIKIAKYAYEIDKFSCDNNGQLTDHGDYTLGVVDEVYNVYLDEAMTNKVGTTEYGPTYQEDFTIVVKGQENNATKYYAQNIIANNDYLSDFYDSEFMPATKYDFNTNFAYLHNDGVRIINSNDNYIPPVNDGFINNVDDVSLYSNILSISGYAYKNSIIINNSNDLVHKIIIENELTKKEYATTILPIGPNNYKETGYISENINILDFDIGVYEIKLQSIHKDYTSLINLDYSIDKSHVHYGKNYHIQQVDGKLVLEVTEKKISESDNYQYLMLKDTSIDENGILRLYGYSAIEGINNDEDSTSHQLKIINQNTNEVEKTISLLAGVGDYDISNEIPYDLDYSYAWFDAQVDTKELNTGLYSFVIETTVDDVVKEKKVYTSSNFNKVYNHKVVDRYLNLVNEYSVSYRLELDIKNYSDLYLNANLPSERESYRYLHANTYDEKTNTIKLQGSALTFNTDYSNADDVSYIIVLSNRETGNQYEFKSGAKDRLDDYYWNNNDSFETDHDLTYTWYDIDIPLNEIENGEYDLTLVIKNKEIISSVDILIYSSIDLLTYNDEDKLLELTKNNNNKSILSLNKIGFE